MAALTIATISDAGATDSLPSARMKKSIRGAAGGVYIGPVLSKAAVEGPSTITHATGAAAGGAEDSTGYRESDSYDASGNTGGGVGFADGSVNTITRPTGRTAYTADGVQGGSTPGRPISSGNHVAAGGGYGGGGNFDKRTTRHESVPVGQQRRTRVNNETVTDSVAGPGPSTGVAADPAAGTVAVVGGAGKVQMDLHADDITGGANGRKGAEIILFARGTDTDTDADNPSGHVSGDGGTDITDAITGLAAGTYAFYARWRKADGNGVVQLSRWSARNTVVVS